MKAPTVLALAAATGFVLQAERLKDVEREVYSLKRTIQSCCVTQFRPDSEIEGVQQALVRMRRDLKACGCAQGETQE
jgi:hypothetical protein